MQPVHPEHVRFLHSAWAARLALVLALVLSTGLVGCGDDASREAALFAPSDRPDPPPPAERDSALALLGRMQRTAFDSAFAHLDRYGFLREMRTEQQDPSGGVTAWRTRTLRYPSDGTAPAVVRGDSMGTVSSSLLAPFTSSGPEPRPTNVATYAFPDDPAYLSDRTQGAFHYGLAPPTSVDGQAARVVEIHPKPTPDGRDQVIRFARLTLARGTNELLAAHTVRSERVLLFAENSEFVLRLQRSPDRQTWVPAATRFQARVDVPFRSPRRFQTESTYSEYVTGDG
jgi:hypothetical protein